MKTHRVFFHVEVEDCLWDEVENPTVDMAAQLEAETIEHLEKVFGTPVRRHIRIDGMLVCSFVTTDLERVRQTIRDNLLTEGNDQIVSGVEYVIVRDFNIDGKPVLAG